MVFRLWGSERQLAKPGRDSIISITAKYRSPAHHDGFNCAKRMISCYCISQERSRKVAYALITAKTSGNDGLLIVSWWWRKACRCVPWYSSDSGRMCKGFSIPVWTVCDNVTEETNPCCVEGFGGHSQWHLLPQCPNKRKCKVGSSPLGYFNLSWKDKGSCTPDSTDYNSSCPRRGPRSGTEPPISKER